MDSALLLKKVRFEKGIITIDKKKTKKNKKNKNEKNKKNKNKNKNKKTTIKTSNSTAS